MELVSFFFFFVNCVSIYESDGFSCKSETRSLENEYPTFCNFQILYHKSTFQFVSLDLVLKIVEVAVMVEF